MEWREMGDFDLHVRTVLANYPTMFKTRLDVLHHIFIVLGCGYEWNEKGGLDYIHSDGLDRLPPVEKYPEPDYLNEYPYTDSKYNNYHTMPDNALPEIRAAAEQVYAACQKAMDEIANSQ